MNNFVVAQHRLNLQGRNYNVLSVPDLKVLIGNKWYFVEETFLTNDTSLKRTKISVVVKIENEEKRIASVYMTDKYEEKAGERRLGVYKTDERGMPMRISLQSWAGTPLSVDKIRLIEEDEERVGSIKMNEGLLFMYMDDYDHINPLQPHELGSLR